MWGRVLDGLRGLAYVCMAVGKEYLRADGSRYVMVQVRMTKEERDRLRRVCVELGISIQEFVRRLLKGGLGNVG